MLLSDQEPSPDRAGSVRASCKRVAIACFPGFPTGWNGCGGDCGWVVIACIPSLPTGWSGCRDWKGFFELWNTRKILRHQPVDSIIFFCVVYNYYNPSNPYNPFGIGNCKKSKPSKTIPQPLHNPPKLSGFYCFGQNVPEIKSRTWGSG